MKALCLLSACGGGSPTPSAHEGSRAQSEGAGDPAPVFDLHEWGVVAVRDGSFEVAAGAGQRATAMSLIVDKPILYVHPADDRPFALRVRVTLPQMLRVAEHYPPTDLSPLEWVAQVEGSCRGTYPADVDARCPGGYCEIGELGVYETDDAACLSVRGVRAPLLFYRLWAPNGGPPLPLEVVSQGENLIITNRGIDTPVGRLLRVRHEGGVVRASAVDVPSRGEHVALGMPTGDASAAWTEMTDTLREIGLTQPEVAAFGRGWRRALFGDALGAEVDGDRVDDLPVDGIDRLTADTEDILRTPRDEDVLLYWLPDANIDALAALDIEPAPQRVRRAFLVRHVIR